MLHPKNIPDQFYIDLAVGVSTFQEVCLMHGLDPDEVDALEDDPEFKQRAALAHQAVEEDGSAFSARMRTIASNTVQYVERMIKDPDVPASTRLEAYRLAARLGKLEPEKAAATQTPTGPQLTLTIIAPDGTRRDAFNPAPKSGLKPALAHEDVEDAEDAEWEEGECPVLAPAFQVRGFF